MRFLRASPVGNGLSVDLDREFPHLRVGLVSDQALRYHARLPPQ